MQVIETVFKDNNVYYITENYDIYKYVSNSIGNRVIRNNIELKGLEIKENKLYVFEQYVMDLELTDDNILQEVI